MECKSPQMFCLSHQLHIVSIVLGISIYLAALLRPCEPRRSARLVSASVPC